MNRPTHPMTTPSTPAGHTSAALLLRTVIEVRWRDLDAFNHVNNANFLTYIEEARLRWFQTLPGAWLNADIAPLLAAVQLNYRKPIEWPATLAVELRVERIGNTSLTLAHRIVAEHDAQYLYADGHSVLVWIDRVSAKPITLPDMVRAACA